MRRFALITVLFLPVLAPMSANAEGVWKTMTGHEITQALTDQKVRYTSASQTFYASGKTLYNQGGRESWGRWLVEGDKYCSTWPPQDLLACYHMDRSGEKIRFVGVSSADDITVGTFVK